jgi:hypothetical protein
MLAVGTSFAIVYGVTIHQSGFFGAEETGQLRRYLSSIVSGRAGR